MLNKYGYDLLDEDTVDEIMYVWEVLEPETIVGQGSWHTYFSKVVKSPSGVPYRVSWTYGSTVYQECDLDLKMVKVKPVETKTIVWEVDNG